MKNPLARITALVALIAVIATTLIGQSNPASFSGHRMKRIVVRNAMVIDGSGKPAAGPFDIVVEGDTIKEVVALDPVAIKAKEAHRPAPGDLEIDAAGKYVLPGLINAHAHTHDERGGVPLPVDYCLKMWLINGITTVRDVWADKKTLAWRGRTASNELAGPRIYAYGAFVDPPTPHSPEEARARVRELKAAGYDGIKLYTVDREVMQAMEDEAHKLGMRIAHHVGVEETNAWDDIRFGTTSIEHWYGIPDAAIDSGRQNFPPSYNYNNEVDRFRYAGRLWREANPEKLAEVLDAMVKANVAWDPTFDIYDASRDLQRAQTNPAFADYLHPVLEEYFRPNPANHGSYFIGWTSTDEAFWKENYRIWMKAVVDFERRGGLVGAGDDAGFIYQMYGFGLIRELELQQEAGFPALKVIQHATTNNARILGIESTTGRIKQGYRADLIVVNGNPLEDLKVFSPLGVDQVRDGKIVHGGGIEWTIKEGIPFHIPTVAAEVRAMVSAGRKARK